MFAKIMLSFLLAVSILVSSAPLAAQNDRLQLVASHSILADVTGNVAGDLADVSLLMPRGADPHSFQPSPRSLTAIADADLVFVNGARFEESLLDAIQNAAGINIIAASNCVDIITPDAEHDEHEDEHAADEHDEDEDEHAADEHDEHEDEHAADEHDEDECDRHSHELSELLDEEEAHAENRLETLDCGEGHGHDEAEDAHAAACDPHVWMDPYNVMLWTLMIRDSLADIDPDNGAAYHANAAAYLKELLALRRDFIEPALETLPLEKRILITSHDSLGYLAASYGFEVISVVASTASEASARDVAALIDLIAARSVPAVFGETTANENTMQTIARETGAELIVLYSGTLSDSEGPAATYLDYMRYNLSAIIEGLNRAD